MWIILAIFASIVWGFDYVFAEKVIKKISVTSFMSVQLLFAFLVTALVAWFTGSVKKDLIVISSSKQLLLFLTLGALAFTAGNFFILSSINSKNATLAGMIEISYPLFIALLAYLLFKENQINLGTAAGGLLIFLGVFVIYYFNR